jgi:hypothetical protein
VDEQFSGDPTARVMECPIPLVVEFAVDAMARRLGSSAAEASRAILDEVVERTAGLDAMAQETAVARVHRALLGEPQPDLRR